MHRSGHYGMNIFLAAPIVAIFLFFEFPILAGIFLLTVAALPMIPDTDQNYTSDYSGYIDYLIFYLLYPLYKITGFLLPEGESPPTGFSDIKHRGITHTIQFAFVFGLTFVLLGISLLFALYTVLGPVVLEFLFAPIYLILFCLFLAGFCCVFFHIIGDTFTPTGINFYSKSSNWGYSFNKFYASDEVANDTSALLGFAALILSISIFFIDSVIHMSLIFIGGYFSLLVLWLLLVTTRVGKWIYKIFL